jgi:hypothetical protein
MDRGERALDEHEIEKPKRIGRAEVGRMAQRGIRHQEGRRSFMRHLLWMGALLAANGAWPAGAQDGASAAFLLPACRLYLQSETRGSRLLLERGVCLGTIEAVLRMNRLLSASASFCPPPQVTLETAVRVVVTFAQSRQDLERPLVELALEAYRQKWPC